MQTATAANPHLQTVRAALEKARGNVARCETTTASGRLTRAVGLVLEAVGLQLPVGSDCLIELPPGNAQRYAEAEVVGFAGDRLFLMSQTEVAGLLPGARVFARPGALEPGASGDAHTCRWATACSAAWSTRPAARSTDWARSTWRARCR